MVSWSCSSLSLILFFSKTRFSRTPRYLFLSLKAMSKKQHKQLLKKNVSFDLGGMLFSRAVTFRFYRTAESVPRTNAIPRGSRRSVNFELFNDSPFEIITKRYKTFFTNDWHNEIVFMGLAFHIYFPS